MVSAISSTPRPGLILNRYGEPIVPRVRYGTGASGPWTKRTAAGVVVNEDTVLEIDTVLACVRVLAESVAALPLELFQWEEEEDELNPAKEHPLYDLVRWQPNEETTSYDLRFEMMVDAIIRGYGAAQVVRSKKGKPIALWPLEARNLQARRAPDDDRLVYTYKSRQKGNTTKEILLESDEMLIIKSFCHGGLLGNSVVRLQVEALGAAKAAESFSSEFFENGSIHSGTIEVAEELSDEAYERLKRDWVASHTGKGNRHKAPILEGGAKFNPLALTNQESQLLETRKYNRSTIAGLLRVPAHFINDLEKATFSNVEHLDIAFVKHSLRPWLTNWEQRLQMTLLTRPERRIYSFCHDLVDMLRGDFPTRMTAYGTAVSNGIMSPNDVRRRERMNPYEGGDIYLVQGALRDIRTPAVGTTPASPAAPTTPAAPTVQETPEAPEAPETPEQA